MDRNTFVSGVKSLYGEDLEATSKDTLNVMFGNPRDSAKAIKIEYALICGEIVRVQVDSYEEYNVNYHEVKDNGYTAPMNCVTCKENFIVGSLEELKNIVLENKQKEAEYSSVETDRVLSILKSLGKSSFSSFENKVLEMLIDERTFVGEDVEEILYIFEDACEGIGRYMECNSSVFDAYMDWAH